ncbi:MAG: hypothetical protein JWO93_1972 [Micrococcaceae bacterium]|jgi:hypothetical protein|nr:hypothetical protein [Micrococcaceae bacterium]
MKTTLRSLRLSWLAVVALVSGAVGWGVTLLANRLGWATPSLPLSSLLTMGVMGAFVLILGFQVLRWRNGKRDRPLNPILAARTVILAQAYAYAGAVLFGWHGGILADQLPTVALRTNLSVVWSAAAIVAGGLLMVVIGLVVERFCRIPPEDGAPPAGPGQTKRSNGEEEYA